MVERSWPQRRRVQRYRVHDGSVINDMLLKIYRERGALIDGSAQIPAEFVEREIGFLGRIRVARVPDLVGEIVEERAAKFIGAGLGENLNSPEADVIVLRRERILGDADLANTVC